MTVWMDGWMDGYLFGWIVWVAYLLSGWLVLLGSEEVGH